MKVAAAGEVLWDLVETAPDGFERRPGGASVNLARVLAARGCSAGVVGQVGDDRLGTDLVARLRTARVDVRGLATRPGRTDHVFVLRDGPSFASCRARVRQPTYIRVSAPWVVLGTSSLEVEKRAALAPLLEQATHLVVDLNPRPAVLPTLAARRRSLAALVTRAILVKVSRRDLGALGFTSEEAALAWLRRRAPAAAVLLTRAHEPASAFAPDGTHVTAAPHTATAGAGRVVGAGDAFLAGAVLALIGRRRASWRDVLASGHGEAARVVVEGSS